MASWTFAPLPLSRRDEFARAALVGLLSRYSTLPAPKDVAAEVVRYADAVITALDQQEQEGGR